MSLRRLLAKATVPREPAPLEAGSKPAVAYAVATPRRRIPDSIAPEVPVLDESLSHPCCSTSTLEAVVRTQRPPVGPEPHARRRLGVCCRSATRPEWYRHRYRVRPGRRSPRNADVRRLR